MFCVVLCDVFLFVCREPHFVGEACYNHESCHNRGSGVNTDCYCEATYVSPEPVCSNRKQRNGFLNAETMKMYTFAPIPREKWQKPLKRKPEHYPKMLRELDEFIMQGSFIGKQHSNIHW